MVRRKKHLLTSIAMLILLTVTAVGQLACAPKDEVSETAPVSAPSVSASQPQVVPKNTISYRVIEKTDANSKSGIQKAASVPSSVAELKQVKASFIAANSLVLPVVVPDEIMIDAVVSAPDLKPAATYVTSMLLTYSNNTMRSFPDAALVLEDGEAGVGLTQTLHFRVRLAGLKAVFSDETQDEVTILVTFANRDKPSDEEARTIKFVITTPPSRVRSTVYVPVSAYEKAKNVTVPNELRAQRATSGELLSLVGIIELQSDDARAVQFSVPLFLSHELALLRKDSSVVVSECGHAMVEPVTKTLLNSTLLLLPIRGNLGSSNAAVRDKSFPILVRAGQPVQIGIYSKDSKVFQLPDPVVKRQSVPLRCNAQCLSGAEGDWADLGKWGGSCLECGRSPDNAGTACFSCMREHSPWCRWQNWRQWKDFTDVTVGQTFKFILSAGAESKPTSALQVSYPADSTKERSVPILTNAINIE